jgi:hypothetical protein
MKVKRRKFNIFEQLEIECLKNPELGPVEEFVLTPKEFKEFVLDAKNRPHTSFKKIVGRPDDEVGGDWSYRGALIRVNGKLLD